MSTRKALRAKIIQLSVVIALVIGIPIAIFVLKSYVGPLRGPLPLEMMDNQFPDRVDLDDAAQGPAWVTLPFGYTFGPWPSRFRDNPIVMKMTYQKGPPQKFIQQMTQVWDPINAELTLEGPKTPIAGFRNSEWKSCLRTSFRCFSEKKKLYELTLQDLEKWNAPSWNLTWFESNDPFAPKGIHVRLELPKFQIDRYLVLTEKGVAQSFTLKSVKDPIGLEAQTLLLKIIGAMKVSDDLTNGRAWIQNKIQRVRLDQVQNILNPTLRFAKLIGVQNALFSELSVDPTTVAPFFHLAGVTHMIAVNLLKGKTKVYEAQDSWISHVEPLLKAIQSYVSDFPNASSQAQNIESLLQDVLLLEQKLSK